MASLQESFQELESRVDKIRTVANNVRTYATLANEARNRGDHTTAKRHLRRALDLEFEIFAHTPAMGALAEEWYPAQEI